MRTFGWVKCVGAAVLSTALVSCASTAADAQAQAPSFDDAVKASFKERGQAGMDRLNRDAMQLACSVPADQSPTGDAAKAIQEQAQARVVFPADGEYFGDWKAGETIAQTGKGMQYSDDPAEPNGGNCYACHQMAPDEIAYGTLGPSLKGYGKLRGTSDPMLQYTWTRLWNSHVYNVCSHMPRFGDAGILTEQQLKDVMAYLFDPKSPVNQ